MAFDYDLFVIGGGSGGVRAARIASGEWGAKVALAEESRMGGTCVIRGCVPKKLMVFASGYRRAMADAGDYGWSLEAGAFDWSRFRGQLHKELDRLEGIYRNTLTKAGVEIFDQRCEPAVKHGTGLILHALCQTGVVVPGMVVGVRHLGPHYFDHAGSGLDQAA